jgi:glucose dehydrogenase
MGTAYDRVVALDADTGKEIWVKNVGYTPSTRGLAYWPGTDSIPPQLVFGTGDGSSLLISLNAKTGEFTEGFGKGGMVDLRQGVGEKFPRLRVALSSPPAIYKNLAITGNHSQESPSLGPAGDIRAWDLRTGQARLDLPHRTASRRAEPRRVERTISGSIALVRTRGDSLPSMKNGASRTCQLGTPATDFTAAIGWVRIFMDRRLSLSTPRQAN